jgi:hypothetical protein
MTTPTCARLFEVEAMRDGRLTGAERTSFERHMASCAACSREAESLDALAEAVRTSDEHDELHIRRERTRLLAAFDDALVRDERPTRRWVWSVAGIALLTCVFVLWRTRSPSAPISPPPPLSAQSTVVQADSTALYSKRTEGARERIVLERGALRIQVTHASARDVAGLLVTLPDGELEDEGTIFTVTAADGRTTHVAVEEGSVVLRLRGRPAIVLRAGEAWSTDPRLPAVRSSTTVSAPVPSATSVPRCPKRRRRSSRTDRRMRRRTSVTR